MNTLIWVGSARYSTPLDDTTRAKWALLAQALPRELIVLAFADGAERQFTDQVRFILLPAPSQAVLRYLVYFVITPWVLARLIRRRTGVTLIAQSPFEGVVAAWMRVLFPRRVRLIVENHNNFEDDVFLQRRIPLQKVVQGVLWRVAAFAFHHADAIRVISTSTSERATAYAPHTPQVRFMTWTNSAAFAHQPRLNLLVECRDIVYAGVLIPRKGVHLLIEAFARLRLPDTRLVLVGAPENADYTAQLQAQASALGVSARVVFVGSVPQAALAQYFARARVMVLPSLSEGLGRVIVEAMWLGTPVIGSRVGGIPDLITDGENGILVPPDDVDALTHALERAFNDPDFVLMGEKARTFALDYFSPQQYADGYQALVEMAEANAPARSG